MPPVETPISQGTRMSDKAASPGLPPYGLPITLERARRVALAAEAEAAGEGWAAVVAVVDSGGHLVTFARMDQAQLGSNRVALQKAETAVHFRRSSRGFQDLLDQGGSGLRALAMPHVIPIDGGLPLLKDGQVVGAVGVSGGTMEQDAKAAAAGAAALAHGD